MTTTFDGRVAFITGASGGIGAAVARMLHDAGASVGLASRRGDDLGLERGLGVACDVRDPEAVDAAVAATVDRFGRLDIVVANAGVGAYGPFLDLAREHLEEMIDTNLKGTLYAVRAALPHLLESDARRRGHACLRGRPAGTARTRPSTAPRSSARSASPARSITSCGRRASAARTSAPAASPPTSPSRRVADGRPTSSPG